MSAIAIVDARDLAAKQDLAELKRELLKWIIGLAMAQMTLLIAGMGIVIAILK